MTRLGIEPRLRKVKELSIQLLQVYHCARVLPLHYRVIFLIRNTLFQAYEMRLR